MTRKKSESSNPVWYQLFYTQSICNKCLIFVLSEQFTKKLEEAFYVEQEKSFIYYDVHASTGLWWKDKLFTSKS